MRKITPVVTISIFFFFIFIQFIFAQRPAIKPIDRDEPDFTPDKVKIENAGRPRCPQSKGAIGLETAYCVSGCFKDTAYKFITGMEPEKKKTVKEIWDCKENCEKTGLEERKLYKACVEALREGIKDEFEIFNAAVIKLGGYLDIVHADGTKEVYGIDVGSKEIKDGDVLNAHPKTSVILHFYNPRIKAHGDIMVIRPGTSIKFVALDSSDDDGNEIDVVAEAKKRGIELLGSKESYKNNTVVELPQGGAWIEVIHWGRDNNFIFWTPNVWVADKGTEFIVNHDPDRKISDVYVFNGAVDVYNLKNKTSTQLRAGETVAVDGDGKEVLRKMSQEESEQLKDEVYSYVLGEGETGQSGATTAAETGTANKKLIFGLIAALILAVSAGIFIYRKRF